MTIVTLILECPSYHTFFFSLPMKCQDSLTAACSAKGFLAKHMWSSFRIMVSKSEWMNGRGGTDQIVFVS